MRLIDGWWAVVALMMLMRGGKNHLGCGRNCSYGSQFRILLIKKWKNKYFRQGTKVSIKPWGIAWWLLTPFLKHEIEGLIYTHVNEAHFAVNWLPLHLVLWWINWSKRRKKVSIKSKTFTKHYQVCHLSLTNKKASGTD